MGDLLYIFSSNAAPFKQEHAYSKFTALALLRHGGDFAAAASELAKTGYGPPQIKIGTDEKRMADEAIAALSKVEGIYQRGGMLVHIVRGVKPPKGIECDPETPRIVLMHVATLRERLADAAKWQKFVEGKAGKKDKWAPTTPPAAVVNAVHVRGEWLAVPVITDVVECPVLRPDGTILQTPGFDLDTGIFYSAGIEFPPVPDSPSQADALKAAGRRHQGGDVAGPEPEPRHAGIDVEDRRRR
ncbi:MAG: hypothetical protein IIC56_00815 [Proteobacteria bacterium]|nr:hypothetical protein [Pseudomonadota bacterium]